MKNCVFAFVLFSAGLVSLESNAQFLQDNNNRPVKEQRYVDISGSPYFNEAYLPGSVLLSDNKSFDKMYLQFDQVQELLLFKENRNDVVAKAFTVPVLKFIMDLGEGKLVKFRHVNDKDEKIAGFYQVIYEGKVSLLKRVKKKVVEKATYGTSNTEKSVLETTSYLISTSASSNFPVKPDKRSFFAAFKDKAGAMEVYTTSKKINFKDDSDLEALIAFYNTLL